MSTATTRTRVLPRILLVEDEHSLVLTLSDRLEAEGYAVTACRDGESALAAAREQPFDLAILDIMLPGMDGLAVCRELRHCGLALPILMLTAKAEVVDKVVGLKLGADDYLTKPFEMIELLARIEVLLRRVDGGSPGANRYAFGDVRVNLGRAEVLRDGAPVAMSSMELRLLECFIRHRGTVLSRDQLLDEVWGYEASPYSRTVDVHVAGLRQKLEPNPSHPRFIITVHRLGYRFDG